MPEMKVQDRGQIIFTSLDYMVDAHSIARVIDAFVKSLDLKGLGFQKSESAHEGRPSYPVESLLKLYIYGQQKMIRSSRRLAEACHVNVEVKWLMEGLEPDFRTISNFRKDNSGCMKKVFYQFNHKLFDLLEKGYLSVDGSKFAANNSKDNNFTVNKLDDRIEWLKHHIEEYLRQLEAQDVAEEDVEGTFTREELEEKLKRVKERLERYEGYRAVMQEEGLFQMSLVDADAKLMKSKNGFALSYNVQTAVDSKTHLIEDYQVTTQATDHGLLESTVHDERERRGGIVEVVADKGYQKQEDMVKCLENGIIPHVIPPKGKDFYEVQLSYDPTEVTDEKRASEKAEDLKECLHSGQIPDAYKGVLKDAKVVQRRRFVKDEGDESTRSAYETEGQMIERAKEGYFVRDPECNVVYCPAGKTLRQKSVRANGERRYANKMACKHCRYRGQCCKGKSAFKEVSFSKGGFEKAQSGFSAGSDEKGAGHYEKYWAVSVKLFPDRKKMEMRKCISEHPFGTIKRAMNGGYYLLRGKQKVEGETALICLGYNLKRAFGLLGFTKMMAAMA